MTKGVPAAQPYYAKGPPPLPYAPNPPRHVPGYEPKGIHAPQPQLPLPKGFQDPQPVLAKGFPDPQPVLPKGFPDIPSDPLFPKGNAAAAQPLFPKGNLSPAQPSEGGKIYADLGMFY